MLKLVQPPGNAVADRNVPTPFGGQESLREPGTINLVLVAIQDHYLYAELFGAGFVAELEGKLKKSLLAAGNDLVKDSDVSLLSSEAGEHLMLWRNCNGRDLADLAYAIKLRSQNELKRTMTHRTGRDIELGIGHAAFSTSSAEEWEKKFLQAVTEARRTARTGQDLQRLELAREFNTILAHRNITTVFQPIADFTTGGVLGWEALTRGPEGTSLHSPIMLFEMAEKLERLFALEAISRESAILGLGPIAQDQKLFLNINPHTVVDPSFTPGRTLGLLEQVGLQPGNIVFEITERHSLKDFALFYRTLDHYRSQGFMVAVDDAGAGYSGLSSIAEIRPDFIKIDMSLVENVERDPVKRALLETITTFAEKIGSRIIAEGIETRAQALCLMEIGVHYGQGYFLARPANPKPQLASAADEIRSMGAFGQRMTLCSTPVGRLAEAAIAVPKDHLVSDAQQFFEKNRTVPSLVVTEDDVPKGLVMEYQLNRQLSTQFGIALYYKRPVTAIMDDAPLLVEDSVPLEEAAHLAMARQRMKAYDDVIVTRRGKLYGVVSVQKMMSVMAQVQVEMAKGTNPLTGLAGNVALEQELEDRTTRGKAFCLIYADLDNFKIYNDTYGFKNGDRVIKLAADILGWAVKKHGPSDSRLFHIGGDDFVVLSGTDNADRMCVSILRCFKRLVQGCYCQTDRDRGWLRAMGRDGQEREYPLVSMSLGIIEIAGRCTLQEISERAALIKKYAKSKPGNVSVRDRRLPLGLQAT